MKTSDPFEFGYLAQSESEMMALNAIAHSLGHGLHKHGWQLFDSYPVFCKAASSPGVWQPSMPHSTNARLCKFVATFQDMVNCLLGHEFELQPEPKQWTVGCTLVQWNENQLKAGDFLIPREVVEEIWDNRPWKEEQ